MSTSHQINPFSQFRTEYMGDSAWKYFVREPFKEYIGERPLVFEGSRGTGKTMFFLCNSWKQKFQAANSQGQTLKDFISSTKHIGFYYKVDTRFVKSMDKKSIDDSVWVGIFNTYFNIVITYEILSFLENLIRESILTNEIVVSICKVVTRSLSVDSKETLSELREVLDDSIASIEHFSNNTEKPKPIGVNAGTIIQNIVSKLKEHAILKDTTFHVFVDEFESLSFNQQVEINTLLKHSDNNVVYDYGVKTKGIQTYKTGTGQEIRPKDDFVFLTTDKYEYHESDGYNHFLIEICKKRLKDVFDKMNVVVEDEKLLSIDFYLKSYGKYFEETLFRESPELGKIKDRIKTEIKRFQKTATYTEEEFQEYFQELTECRPIFLRMHLALLLRRGKYAVSPRELVLQKRSDSAKYQDWVHNMDNALVFLLCHELKVEKKYHGFKVFSALSSGVIRSFLELAEYAFDYAFNNNVNPFTFRAPRPLEIDEQTKAVYFVSKFKVSEIESYEPSGLQLKIFTIALGKIFHALHVNPNATLGEVEFNHFTTKTSDLRKERSEASVLLSHAIMHKILEEVEPTKTKSEEVVEFLDYHLNHIYCPAFKISHLRKRKLPISAIDLSKLFNGSQKELEDVVNKLSGYVENETPNLFSDIT